MFTLLNTTRHLNCCSSIRHHGLVWRMIRWECLWSYCLHALKWAGGHQLTGIWLISSITYMEQVLWRDASRRGITAPWLVAASLCHWSMGKIVATQKWQHYYYHRIWRFTYRHTHSEQHLHHRLISPFNIQEIYTFIYKLCLYCMPCFAMLAFF